MLEMKLLKNCYMFEINDIVKLKPGYEFLFILLPSKEYKIKEVLKVDTAGTSGQWIKINEYNDWIDSSYLTK